MAEMDRPEAGRQVGRRADDKSPPEQQEPDETVRSLLRDVTHELKSPLTAIRGHAQLLHNRALREGRAADDRSATTIIEQVQRITAMLDKLLDRDRPTSIG